MSVRRARWGLMLVAALCACGETTDLSVDAAHDTAPDAPEPTDTFAEDALDAALDASVDQGPSDTALDAARDASTDVRRDAGADASRDGAMDAARDVATDVVRDAGMDAVVRDGGGSCPSEMVLVAGRVCVDRWEASTEELLADGGVRPWSPFNVVDGRRVRAVSAGDVVPQGYISGSQAQAACREAGKRLCTLTEWLAACRGPENRTYPYGNTYVRRRCNEARTPHPVVQFYGTSVGVFTSERMNNPGINMLPDSLARTGAFTDCVSSDGLFDMVGNLHEWISDTAGTFKGGFYVDAEINGHGCLYTTTAHGFTYHDYSTGFRCCMDPR